MITFPVPMRHMVPRRRCRASMDYCYKFPRSNLQRGYSALDIFCEKLRFIDTRIYIIKKSQLYYTNN